MSLIYLLDTNMVTYIVRGRSIAARRKLASLGEHEVACISAITEAEMRYGIAKKPQAHVVQAAIEGFLARAKILPWGSAEAAAYGILRAQQEAAGKTLDALDMLIAAQAFSTGATVVTNDRAFSQIPGIRPPVNWATDL